VVDGDYRTVQLITAKGRRHTVLSNVHCRSKFFTVKSLGRYPLKVDFSR